MISLKALTVVSVTAILVAGCISYDQELVLNDDGSGVVKVHYLSEYRKGMAGEPELSFSEDDIISEYLGSDLTVRDIDIYLPGDDEVGSYEATYYIDFKDIADLNGYGITDVKNGIRQKLSFTEVNDEYRIEQIIHIIAEIDKLIDWTDWKFTYKITCPGIITDTNGTVEYGSRTVTWEFTVPELAKRPVKIYAVYGGYTGTGQGCVGPGMVSD